MVTMTEVWSSVDLTLEVCSASCTTATCNSGKHQQCNAIITSYGGPISIQVYGGGYQPLSSSTEKIYPDDIYLFEPYAGVIGAAYSITIQ